MLGEKSWGSTRIAIIRISNLGAESSAHEETVMELRFDVAGRAFHITCYMVYSKASCNPEGVLRPASEIPAYLFHYLNLGMLRPLWNGPILEYRQATASHSKE